MLSALLLALLLGHAAAASVYDGFELQKAGDAAGAAAVYEAVLAQDPANADAHNLLGALAIAADDLAAAVPRFEAAAALAPQRADLFENLGFALRRADRVDLALPHLRHAAALAPGSARALTSLGLGLSDAGDRAGAVAALAEATRLAPEDGEAAFQLGLVLDEAGDLPAAREALERAIALRPAHARAWFNRGMVSYKLDDAAGALHHLTRAMQLDPADELIVGNVGVWHHRFGDMTDSLPFYERALELDPASPSTLNNFGTVLTLLGMSERGAPLLERAIALDPANDAALANLAVHHYEEGTTDEARRLYERAYAATGRDAYLLRIALLIHPVIESRASMEEDRRRLERSVAELLARPQPLSLPHPVSDVERMHFYAVYHGLNDRVLNERLAQLFIRAAPDLLYRAPWLAPPAARPAPPADGRIRVGFTSKYFVRNHAHGQLLHGAIGHLSRERFTVVVLAVPKPGDPVTEYIAGAADELIMVPPTPAGRRAAFADAQLDVLVFAEVLSDPMGHFQLYNRYAPVQCAFWGNPVTSGVPTIDYFISGEHMEVQNTGADADSHYTEQPVLLRGQAIWYDRLQLPQEWDARAAHGLRDEWHVYMCLQSVFKLHPDFDEAVVGILRGDAEAHVVFIEGRRKRWTRVFLDRLARAAPDVDVRGRVHAHPRVPGSDPFLRLLNLADVVLHPFPFDGSKTSSDALALGKPMVTMPTQFLRGRMGYSFYAAMELFDLVAHSVDEYVAIALRLGRNRAYREYMSQQIRQRSDRIWEDPLLVREWENFLTVAVNQAEAQGVGRWALSGRAPPRRPVPHPEREPAPPVRDAASLAPGQVVTHEWAAALREVNRLVAVGDAHGAERVLRGAVALDPGNAYLLNDLAGVLQMQWRSDEAVALFEEAVRLRPDFERATVNLGVLLYETGRKLDALRVFAGAAERWRRSDDAWSNLANTYRELQRPDDGLAHFSRLMGVPLEELPSLVAMGMLAPEYIPDGPRRDWAADLSANFELTVNALARLMHMRGYLDAAQEWLQALAPPVPNPVDEQPQPQEEVHLIVQFFEPAGDPARAAELRRALQRNIDNPHITAVHVLSESPVWLPTGSVRQTVIRRRLTFRAAFEYANEHVPAGAVALLANADIWFDASAARLGPLVRGGDVLALLRWEAGGRVVLQSDSQDAWAFRAPLLPVPADTDFQLGQIRCDNHLAAVLKAAGRRLRNPFLAVRAHHEHAARERDYSNRGRVLGDISSVQLALP